MKNKKKAHAKALEVLKPILQRLTIKDVIPQNILT